MSQDSYELSRTHIQVNMIKGSAETFRIALVVSFYVIIYQILCMYHKTPFIYSKCTDEMAAGMVARWRVNGLISKEYDISKAFDNKFI